MCIYLAALLSSLSPFPSSTFPPLPTYQPTKLNPTDSWASPHHLLSLPSGRLLLPLLLGRLPPATACYRLLPPAHCLGRPVPVAVASLYSQYKSPASAREISYSGPQQPSPILSVLSCQRADHPPVTSSTPTPRRPLPHTRLRRRLLAPFRQSAFPPPPSAINPQSTIRIARGRRLRSLAAALALPCWLASSWRTS